jgi:predicted nucleotidyltransferase
MITGRQIIEQLSALKPQLHKEFAVKTIGLFGSFADGSQTEQSDIDILVELERSIGWKFFTLEMFHVNVF